MITKKIAQQLKKQTDLHQKAVHTQLQEEDQKDREEKEK